MLVTRVRASHLHLNESTHPDKRALRFVSGGRRGRRRHREQAAADHHQIKLIQLLEEWGVCQRVR